ISVTSFFNSGIDSVSIPHNLIIVGDVVVVSHYFDGLYIFNISDPTNPTISGFYDTSTEPHAIDFKGAWGIYPLLPSGIIAVSDMQSGLFLFDASDAITSVDEPQRTPQSLQVYPNPFKDGIFYTANGSAPSARYQLHDLTGRLILSGRLSGRNGHIAVPSDLVAGMYLLRVLDDAGSASQTHKLIKR
ncbi:MAG: T9SS type A sorting domain-containing protein, partial [Bacteroidota bacterium]